jgi:hypothetical protein
LIEMVQGHCDWELAYVDPESEEESLSALEVLEGIRIAQETGTRATVEDGQLHIPDQEIDSKPAGQRPQSNGSPGETPEGEAAPGEPPPGDQQPSEERAARGRAAESRDNDF